MSRNGIIIVRPFPSPGENDSNLNLNNIYCYSTGSSASVQFVGFKTVCQGAHYFRAYHVENFSNVQITCIYLQYNVQQFCHMPPYRMCYVNILGLTCGAYRNNLMKKWIPFEKDMWYGLCEYFYWGIT